MSYYPGQTFTHKKILADCKNFRPWVKESIKQNIQLWVLLCIRGASGRRKEDVSLDLISKQGKNS